jgi:diaminopropionate ammonia-lyase
MIEPNKHADFGKALIAVDQEMLGADAAARVTAMLRLHPSYKVTPLQPLDALAKTIGVGAIHIKDESARLGLGSFKALGGAYAVVGLVLEEATRTLNRPVSATELLDPNIRAIFRRVTVGCATDGNHGRSVAAGANLVGCAASIFVHDGVSEERVAAIARFGADIIRVKGNYDDAVVEAERVCKAEGWIIVSDTSWPGYERIPRLVMQGYTAMVSEVLAKIPQPPTHVFLQAGVGGFAASVAANLALTLGHDRPKFIVVEPDRAACLFASNRAGRPVKVEPTEPTVMAMLECYEPSLLAWGVLSRLADAYMTISDADAIEAMKCLARPNGSGASVIAGESGGAGLAGLIEASRTPANRALLGLDRDSRVLLFNTEGATAPDIYKSLTGFSPAEAMSAQ